MVGYSTSLALKRRALKAADWIQFWEQHLKDEMKKQNIDLYPPPSNQQLIFREDGEPAFLEDDDSMMTVTLTRRDVRELLRSMNEQKIALRKFTNWK